MDELHYWLFINIKNQMRSRKISQSKADLLIGELSEEDVNDWFAWTSVFRDWLPLKNIVVQKDGIFQLLVQIKDDYVESGIHENINEVEATVIIDRKRSTHIPDKYLALESLIEEKPLDEGDLSEVSFRMEDIISPSSESSENVDILEINESDFLGEFKYEPEIESEVGVDSDVETLVNKERRAAARHNIKIEVLILAKGLSFRAETVNLSQAGVLLSRAIPESLAQVPLEVVFILKNSEATEKMAVNGKVLSTRENLRYLSFSNLTFESKNFFERLIKNYFQEIN
jgi:hypothetical protein